MNNFDNHSNTEYADKQGRQADNVCPKCGAILERGQNFCPKCGTSRNGVRKICSKCGSELTAGQIYCPKCGTKYGENEVVKTKSLPHLRTAFVAVILIELIVLLAYGVTWYFNIRCQETACFNAASKGEYCSEHVCQYKNCEEPRITGSKYCLNHICSVPGCVNRKLDGSAYCSEHDLNQLTAEFLNNHTGDDGYSTYEGVLTGKRGWLTKGEDGSWVKICTIPAPELGVFVSAGETVMKQFNEFLLKKLGFPSSLAEQQYVESEKIGTQTAESDAATVSWYYSSENGFMITYTLKNK